MKYFLRLCLMVAVIEIATRFMLGAPVDPPEPIMPDPILNHRWRPNLERLETGRPVAFTHRTNSAGLVEDHEVSHEKKSRTIRILYVGDSNTQGVVDTPYKSARILERDLNAHFEGKRLTFEVINAGVSSYSPILYYLYLKTELLAYEPDLVIMNVDMTDAVNDAEYEKLASFDADGAPLAVHASPPFERFRYLMTPTGLVEIPRVRRIALRMNRFLKENCAVYFHVMTRLQDKVRRQREKDSFDTPVVPGPAMGEANWLAMDWTPEIQSHVDFSMKMVGLAVDLLKKKSIACIVTGIPHHPQYSGVWSARPHLALAEEARKSGAWFFNAYEAMKGKVEGTPVGSYYWNNDPTHLNIDGNALLAQNYMSFLLDSRNGILASENGKKSWLDKKLEAMNGQST